MTDWRDRIIEVKRMRVRDIQGHPQNWREHPQRQREALTASLNEVGQADVLRAYYSTKGGGEPVLTLWDGHHRKGLDPDAEWWIAITDLDDAEAALMLATFDPIAALAETNAERLAAVLADVRTGEAALQTMLAEMAEQAGIGAKATTGDTPPQVDKAAELQAKWNTQTGQLWALGEHRLIVGDCTDKATVERVMGGEQPDIILSDPPYSSGGFQEAGRKSGSIGTRQNAKIAADQLSTRGYLSLIGQVISLVNADVLYLFTDWRMWSWTCDIVEQKNYPVRNMLVWDKGQMGMGFPWRSTHELIVFAKRTPAKMMDGKRGNVLRFDRSGNDNHPTEKPVDLMVNILENTEGALVYDPFLGSGTTLIACENLSRRCRAVEISPSYCAVAIERWVQHTGQTPQLLEP